MPDLRQLFNDIIRFEIELWNAVDARLKSEFDLPLTHFEPMSVIGRLPGCRVYDIAAELGITPGGTSKLIDRIEANGYCRRLPNPADRRSSLLELTPEGRRVLDEAGVAFDDELRRLLGSGGTGADPAPVRGHAHPPSGGQRSHRDGRQRLARRELIGSFRRFYFLEGGFHGMLRVKFSAVTASR